MIGNGLSSNNSLVGMSSFCSLQVAMTTIYENAANFAGRWPIIAKVSLTTMDQNCGIKIKITIIKARWRAALVYVNFTPEPWVTRQTVACVSTDFICAISCWDRQTIDLQSLILAEFPRGLLGAEFFVRIALSFQFTHNFIQSLVVSNHDSDFCSNSN